MIQKSEGIVRRKKCVLESFTKFKEKQLLLSLLFYKLAGPRLAASSLNAP